MDTMLYEECDDEPEHLVRHTMLVKESDDDESEEEQKISPEKYEMFEMAYTGCFLRLKAKYPMAIELISVSALFNEVSKMGIEQGKWAGYIKRRLTKITVNVIWGDRTCRFEVNVYGNFENLISTICREFSAPKDQLGEIKFENGTELKEQNGKTLLELGLRSEVRLFISKL